MIPHHLVFFDLETTGVNPLHDRIIEVGLCEVQEGEIVQEWSTLVNPLKIFSPFIENLTGITNAMAAGAPVFGDLALDLLDRLTGKILVAHNARFDYGFLTNEFRRLGVLFREKTLCTVKLSRALFPRESRHNLDALIQRHDLVVTDRHRALGDARVIREFFSKLCAEFPPESLDRAMRRQLKEPGLPFGPAMEATGNLFRTPDPCP